MSALAPILEAFFTDRLVQQRHASPHTIAAYRDAWRLLLRFAAANLTTAPSKLKLCDLDAPLIGRFLEHLEGGRANTVRTRNARLSAIHALFRYAALEHPDRVRLFCVGGPERGDEFCDQHGKSYLTRRRRGEEGGGGGSTGGTIPSA